MKNNNITIELLEAFQLINQIDTKTNEINLNMLNDSPLQPSSLQVIRSKSQNQNSKYNMLMVQGRQQTTEQVTSPKIQQNKIQNFLIPNISQKRLNYQPNLQIGLMKKVYRSTSNEANPQLHVTRELFMNGIKQQEQRLSHEKKFKAKRNDDLENILSNYFQHHQYINNHQQLPYREANILKQNKAVAQAQLKQQVYVNNQLLKIQQQNEKQEPNNQLNTIQAQEKSIVNKKLPITLSPKSDKKEVIMVVREMAKNNPIAKKISNNIQKVDKMKLELVLINEEFKNNKQIQEIIRKKQIKEEKFNEYSRKKELEEQQKQKEIIIVQPDSLEISFEEENNASQTLISQKKQIDVKNLHSKVANELQSLLDEAF